MEQCRSTCYFDDSMGIGMRTGFGTRMRINLRPHDEEEILNNKPSLQNIIEWFCFAFIMSLLVIFILCSFVALFLKIRAYAKKKFNK